MMLLLLQQLAVDHIRAILRRSSFLRPAAAIPDT
jgi:hypothetical protein